MIRIAVLLVVAACSSSSTSSPVAAPPSAARATEAEPEGNGLLCSAMAAKYYAPKLAETRDTPLFAIFERQRDAMIAACRATVWPDYARRCFAERTITDNTCMDRLAPPQRDDWRTRSEAAVTQ